MCFFFFFLTQTRFKSQSFQFIALINLWLHKLKKKIILRGGEEDFLNLFFFYLFSFAFQKFHFHFIEKPTGDYITYQLNKEEFFFFSYFFFSP